MLKKPLIYVMTVMLSLLVTVQSRAQDIETLLDDVRKQAEHSFVSVRYEAEIISENSVFHDSGVIEAQDGMWHLKGEFLELYTDAAGTWVVDNASREAYVEPAWAYDDLKSFYETAVSQGAQVKVEVISTVPSERKPVSFFTPVLSSEWVITDLR